VKGLNNSLKILAIPLLAAFIICWRLCVYRNCLRLQRPRIGFCVRESRKPGRLESKRQRRYQTQTHTSDVLRTPDLRARENFRTDKVSGRTGKGAACLCTRHVRKPGQGICILQTL